MRKIDNNYKYPCTRNINIDGFGTYLEKEIGEPRRNLRLFANEFGNLISAQGDNIADHLVLVNSGSSANLVAALTIAEKCKKANKPLTAVASAFTFPTTVSSLLLAGFKIKLIDVDKSGFNMSIDRLTAEKEIPSLVVVTHFLGFPADMEALKKYQSLTKCFILQDACETLDTYLGNKPLYKYGDIITWSFYHPHHLSSYGGGAIFSISGEDYSLLDSIAHWGRACKCHIDEKLCFVPSGPAHQFTYENISVNIEMSELNACFGRWQLKNWKEIENQRQRNYQTLYDIVSANTNLLVYPFHNARHDSPFVFPVFCKNKSVNDIYEFLKKKNIEIRTLMGGATCQQPAFTNKISYDNCSNAIYMSQHAFFVGCHHTLSDDDVKYIGNSLLCL